MIKLHFLQWDREPIQMNLMATFIGGYQRNTLAHPKECYKTYEIQDPEYYTLDNIYKYYNSDGRLNGGYERSMCVGDIIELEDGSLHAVEILGFNPITFPEV